MSGPIPATNGGTGADTVAAARINLGININSTRNYSSVSLAFNTSRTPNATNDVLVICSLREIVTVLQSSTINIQVDTGSGFTTIETFAISGVAADITTGFSFVVPMNCSYKIISSGTGTNSISSIYELTL